MTLHSPQVHGFFSVPVDHLHALRELAGHFRGHDLSSTVVVSPDLGNAKSAAAFARLLGLPVAAGAKQRISDHEVAITSIIGDVDRPGRDRAGRRDRARHHDPGAARPAARARRAARSASPAPTGCSATGALERIAAEPEVTGDRLHQHGAGLRPGCQHDKLTVLSVAPALAEAIRRIHEGESVSALFEPH